MANVESRAGGGQPGGDEGRNAATSRQLEVLRLISDGWARQEPPTYRQMAEGLGFRSTGAVAYHVAALVERGLLEPVPTYRRLFRLTRAGRVALADARSLS